MKIMKCPRCDLNYIREGEKLCRVCAREMKMGLSDTEETVELCAACGERPALPGKDMCAKCLRDNEDLKKDDLEEFVDDEDELEDDVAELSAEDPMEFGEPGLQTTSLSALEEEEFNVDDDDEY